MMSTKPINFLIRYEAKPFNIYIFPQEYKGHSAQITLDVSAIEFNKKYNMDWNKWINQGSL